jgi:ketosteroid isomerase-like protein
MSQETVDIVRHALGEFASGDVKRVAACFHDDFEGVVAPELSAEPDTYRGYDGIRRYFESFRETFEQIRFEPEGFADAGDAVVVAICMTAVGKLTKIPVEQHNAGVWTVRDGKVSRIETYASFEEALAAAGL